MKNVKPKDIKRDWHLVDATSQILGRLSSQVATRLMGKNKNYYVSHLDTGDFVVVVNAKKIKLSGKKENQKNYYHHSGYPGGLYVKTAAQLRSNKPDFLVRNAVKGMLPKSKLGRKMIKKLFIFPGEQHKFEKQLGGALR